VLVHDAFYAFDGVQRTGALSVAGLSLLTGVLLLIGAPNRAADAHLRTTKAREAIERQLKERREAESRMNQA
jgi:hypothetical protein